MSSKYSLQTTIWKGIKYVLIFGVPYVIATWIELNPEISSLTVGFVLTAAINFIKNYHK